ncbi:hypothetical protein B0T26DRAFT_656384 [Lasiosphaeria miniovina]|uniref:Defect at low temperature protein 1 n=1 Tax=Lasiosphaeria miniovina TaxID=1954250 RepID=A0AA39ZZC4_9PEZI|nr:uncharacterized protein B0T26DRAFT_656384 [Lasiosphaeria miniovina]KAK0706364.1 hypothetical protein B0T26DRAFT_656384 [Lasiosphaeria miniovina]
MSAASRVFRIVYNFFYYFLYLVLLAFLIVTPADLIHQAVQRQQNYNILIIALAYLTTVLIISFVYAARLYINRSVLASIPKSWVPIEKGDVKTAVRQVIVEGISRSAAIAYEARPRVSPVAPPQQQEQQHETVVAIEEKALLPSTEKRALRLPKLRKSAASDRASVSIDLIVPHHIEVWGEIEHPGWAPPTSPDLPNLQYDAVISELPHLVEAKALTLAPPDPESQADPPLLDPEAVALLQRPESLGLREYLTHLTELGVLAPPPLNGEFLAKYESARFSSRPLTIEQFRNLMHLFADILRNMYPLSPAALARYDDSDGDDSSALDSDIDNDAPRGGQIDPLSTDGPAGGGGGASFQAHRRPSSSTDSSGRLRPGMPMRNSSANTWQFRTAPTTPKSRHTGLSRASSTDTFAQTRHPYPASQASTASLPSTAGGSVIRLAGSDDATGLPYVLMHPQSQ